MIVLDELATYLSTSLVSSEIALSMARVSLIRLQRVQLLMKMAEVS